MHDKVVYLTPEGKQRFTAELHELVNVRRREVEDQIRRAKEFSDTVDNAEYDEAKTEQSFVEGRILELERLLASAKLIEQPTTKADFVRMGAHIKVIDLATNTVKQLTFSEGSNESPSWAPNGRHLAFSSTRAGKTQIFTSARDGKDLRQVTRSGNNYEPDWSKK